MTTSRTMQSLVQMYLDERHSAGFALEIPGRLPDGDLRVFPINGVIAVPSLNNSPWTGFKAAQNGPLHSPGPAGLPNDPAFR